MKLCLTALLLCIFIGVSYSQKKENNALRKSDLYNAIIDKEKPAVYITYDKTSTFKHSKLGDSNTYDVIWLRFHNNMKANISFSFYDESISLTGKPGIYYKIEQDPNTELAKQNTISLPFSFPKSDFVTRKLIKSGQSFQFGIPKFHFVDNTRIALQFYYPWEVGNESNGGDQPSHYLYFYNDWIPKQKKTISTLNKTETKNDYLGGYPPGTLVRPNY